MIKLIFMGTPDFSVPALKNLIKSEDIKVMLLLASPALVASFLIAPVPNYHNVMTLLGNIYKFYTGRKKYYWRGWCASYGNNRNK